MRTQPSDNTKLPASMFFRDYRPEDFPRICAVDHMCFPPGIAYPPQDLAYWLREPGAFVIVAEDETTGHIAGFTLGRTPRPGEGHIVTIDVLPEWRRMGIATALMERAHTRLKEQEAGIVRLETSVENAAGIAFYHKLGYRKVGLLPKYYLDRTDAWLMVKDL